MTAKKNEEFDEDLFETRLEGLKDTQDGIQQMSLWCLEKRSHHKKIVQCWLNVFKKARVEQRLVLFYLANDVIQYSKRKRYEFVESWATALQRATTMVRDEKVKNKILRIFKIWADREIYNEDYLSDLKGLLNMPPPKKPIESIDISSDEFSNAKIIAFIRECVKNADSTDKSLKKVPKLPYTDAETLKLQLKDKTHTEDVEKDLDRYTTYMKVYYKNLQTELKTRRDLLAEISKARKFYHGQLGEVKVVASAYKNFGLRIRNLQKKLNELMPNLPSPIPSPDINAPSPEPDADLQLPDDHSSMTSTFFKNSINGYSSYLDTGNLPFDINDFDSDELNALSSKTSSQRIEVIGGRSDDESFASNSNVDYFKPTPIGGYSSNSNIPIPGLNSQSMQSEYTSLARSSASYASVLPPPPNPPVFDGNSYSSIMSAYRTDNAYRGTSASMNNVNNSSNASMMQSTQHIPPPPIPPTGLPGAIDTTSTNNWNMPWNTSSNPNVSNSYNPNLSMIDTPISPARFDREPRNTSGAPIEYSEENDLLSQTGDVDHRDLHLSPFSIGLKPDLSKEKTRQLDIDHRNLISLTGSPRPTDAEKKSWPLNSTGDVDYRATNIHTLKTIDTIPMPSSNSNTPSPGALMPPPLSNLASTTPPQKHNSGSSSDMQREENSARYDPTDMVIDMDMSDEDLDDILREVEDQKHQGRNHLADYSHIMPPGVDDESIQSFDTSTENNGGTQMKTPLLETPSDYSSPQSNMGSVWDTSNMMNVPGYNTSASPTLPPQPRMSFSPAQQQYQPFIRPAGNGRGRGWTPHTNSSPYRPQQMRPTRGARGGNNFNASPFFNRGGNGAGGYRGRRGKNAWI